jgi:type III secretion protein L
MAVIGKVIKSDNVPQDSPAERPRAAPRQVVRSEEFEAQRTAGDIISEARQTAEQIKADARQEAERLREEAVEQGRQQGLASMSEQIAKAKLQAGQLLAQHEQDVIGLALKLAEKIIGREVERDPQRLVELYATAAENVRTAKALVFRVNPANAAILRQEKKDLIDLIGRAVDVAIKEDADVEDLGCIIQTEFGTVDARLPTQLEMLQQLLLEDENAKDGPA